ncbi:hypothetical protein [Streptomyces sp. NPDC088733]|uniref:hypothetical protein n=1 Tax=Streptomyces sp. NPDC088733 TaxID=3365880 RepID=UPI0038176927
MTDNHDWYAPGPGPMPAHTAHDSTAVLPPVGDEGTAAPAPGGRAARRRQAGRTPVDRTGSPIIAPGMQPAALTAAFALLLAGGALLGRPALAAAAVLLQAVTAAGWFRLNGMWPARQGIALAFLAGVTAEVAVLLDGADNAPAVIIGTLGVWLLFVLVMHLRHHGTPEERLSSLTATAASTLITVLATGFLAATAVPSGEDAVVTAVVAVGVATLARALPLPGAVSVLVALAAATGSGIALARLETPDGALIALAAGVCALIGLRVASYDFPSRFVHFTAGVALPLTAAAPAVYVLARALLG